MLKYFKSYQESLEGEVGACYLEVDENNVIVRQVTEFGKKLFWATPDGHADERHMFTDQPEIDEALDELEVIAPSEFADVWKRSMADAGGAG
jgi:hypothetical protein